VLVVGQAALLGPKARQPDGRFLYDLVTGHPNRSDGDLVSWVEVRQWTDAS
jgi:hypothetical protein